MAVKNSFVNMSACLVCITAVCALLLAGIYKLTEKPIKAAEEKAKQEAIKKVSPAYAYMEEVAANDSVSVSYVKTYNADSVLVAYVFDASSSKGFGGKLNLKVGFTPDGKIYRTTVLSHSETPGLGAKCQTDSAFIKQFEGLNLTGENAVKVLSVKKDNGTVDAITASTITSRAYCDALNNAIAAFEAVTGIGAQQDVEKAGDVTGAEAGAQVGAEFGSQTVPEAAKTMEGKKNE